MEIVQAILGVIVDIGTLLFEYIGVIILIITAIRGLICYIKHDPSTRLTLAKGLAMGLEFKLGSEILRTVIVRDITEVVIVGAIIVLRGALALLIHWEIKNSKNEAIEEK